MQKLIVVTALALLAACSTTYVNNPEGDAEAAIRQADVDFATALNGGDMAKVMAFYTDDAVVLPPNAPPFRGKAAIQQFWTAFLATAKFHVTLTPDNVMQSGDLATEVGHYDLTITPNGGGPAAADSGKFAVTWKKAGGKWLIAVDMFSSNNPPPPSAPH